MLLDWAFFRCFINLANHFLSIWVHFLSFNPSMKSKGMHITNSLLASNSSVLSLNSFWCLAWMVALFSSYTSITHWITNFFSFHFEQTALIFLIVIKSMWPSSNCCGVVDFFLFVPHHPFHLFWNNLWSNRQYLFHSIPSSYRFVINGWHCRHSVQRILNWSGHTIVDDKFLFVNDGSIRLWEHRIRGYHLPIHMISDSWTTQKENVQKFVWKPH